MQRASIPTALNTLVLMLRNELGANSELSK